MNHPGSFEQKPEFSRERRENQRMPVVNILKIKPHWKPYDDGTEILFVHGVQVAYIQPCDEAEAYEVYTYDSDFQQLFQSLNRLPYDASKEELKNKVENIFAGWLNTLFEEFTGKTD